MNNANIRLNFSNYSQKCTSCRTLVRRDTLQELQQMFVSHDGRPLKSCKTCRDNVSTDDFDDVLKPHQFILTPTRGHRKVVADP
ncbi:hypothetical protein V1523DRAFT_41775 [Lipomyces doorenjongii]